MTKISSEIVRVEEKNALKNSKPSYERYGTVVKVRLAPGLVAYSYIKHKQNTSVLHRACPVGWSKYHHTHARIASWLARYRLLEHVL